MCDDILPFMDTAPPFWQNPIWVLALSWLVNQPPPRTPPPEIRVLIAGLIKGNQRVFISPDHKGPRLFLGGVRGPGGVGWPVMILRKDPDLGIADLSKIAVPIKRDCWHIQIIYKLHYATHYHTILYHNIPCLYFSILSCTILYHTIYAILYFTLLYFR